VTAQLPLPLPHEPSFAREDFLAAPENMAALAMIDAWPRWPSPVMLLLGPPGSGKSHLGAIFVGATAAKAVAGRDLGAVDADAATVGPSLLIDDADAVGATEAPLFHLLNFARQRGTSVLMTARAPPDLWGVATPDLLSRLRLAPIVEIGPPEVSLVEAVLTKLFSDRQLSVEPALVAYIARRLDRSLDAARVVVDALDKEALARGKKVTRAMAGEVLERRTED
jgi:chromosomal replication initiation ATPase DnaA